MAYETKKQPIYIKNSEKKISTWRKSNKFGEIEEFNQAEYVITNVERSSNVAVIQSRFNFLYEKEYCHCKSL